MAKPESFDERLRRVLAARAEQAMPGSLRGELAQVGLDTPPLRRTAGWIRFAATVGVVAIVIATVTVAHFAAQRSGGGTPTTHSTAIPGASLPVSPSPSGGADTWSVSGMHFFGGDGWVEEVPMGGDYYRTRLFHTSDSGAHWSAADPPFSLCNGCAWLGSIFATGEEALSVGAPPATTAALHLTGMTLDGGSINTNTLTVVVTHDGGRSWSPATIRDGIPVESASGSFAADGRYGLLALELQHGSGVAGITQLWATSDGGTSWSKVSDQGPDGGLTVISPLLAYAASGNPEVDQLERSRNGGSTWEPVYLPPPPSVSGAFTGTDGPPQFADSQDGLLVAQFGGGAQVGGAGPTPVLVMYRTSDAGAAWQPGQPLIDVALSNHGAGWVVGGPSNAPLISTIIGEDVWISRDSGMSWVEPDSSLPATLGFGPAAIDGDGVIFIAGSSATCPGKQPPCSYDVGMMTSKDAGASWTPVPVPGA